MNLVIDRGIQAGIVVNTWDQYAAVPHNRADLQDYDTKGAGEPVTGTIPKTPVSKGANIGSAVPGRPYASPDNVLAEAQKFNSRRPYDELRDDLEVTANVIPLTAENVERWKKDPNSSDLHNIDTKPRHITWWKADWVRTTYTKVGKPGNQRGLRLGGTYSSLATDPDNKMKNPRYGIKVNTEADPYLAEDQQHESSYAHEVGHAFHHTRFHNPRAINGLPGSAFLHPFPQEELKDVSFSSRPSKENITYRSQKHELFADAFSAWVANPEKYGPRLKGTLGIIEKRDPGFHIGIKKAGTKALDAHIGLLKKGKYPRTYKRGKAIYDFRRPKTGFPVGVRFP